MVTVGAVVMPTRRDGPGGVTVASVNAEDALGRGAGREGGWIRVRGGEHDAGDW